MVCWWRLTNPLSKLYESKLWLKRKLYHDHLTPEQIAKLCGVSHMTIYRKMKEYGFKR